MEEIIESSDSASYKSSEDDKKAKKKNMSKYDDLDPTRENLRFRSIAKYRAIQDGEMQMYSDIENRMLTLAQMKGIACQDS